jgi:hypothetical protein
MDEDKSRSGIFYNADGKPEVFWNGRSYGCVIPEELIDAELSALKNKYNGGKKK